MKRITAALVLLLALTACQKAADDNKVRQDPVSQSEAAPAANSPAQPVVDSGNKETKETVYRTITAKVYRSDESIEIMVPEDVDVESRRLIEYKLGDDGKYYFVSLIPQ